MKYRVYFHGGSSYGCADWNGEPDYTVSSIKRACELLDRIPNSRRFPCVDAIPPEAGGPELILFKDGNDSDYPDFAVFFGKRGGIRISRL